MAKRVSTDAWVGRTTVPKGKVVVEEQEAFLQLPLPLPYRINSACKRFTIGARSLVRLH